MYDALTHWDLSKADAPSVLIPGLATSAALKGEWSQALLERVDARHHRGRAGVGEQQAALRVGGVYPARGVAGAVEAFLVERGGYAPDALSLTGSPKFDELLATAAGQDPVIDLVNRTLGTAFDLFTREGRRQDKHVREYEVYSVSETASDPLSAALHAGLAGEHLPRGSEVLAVEHAVELHAHLIGQRPACAVVRRRRRPARHGAAEWVCFRQRRVKLVRVCRTPGSR